MEQILKAIEKELVKKSEDNKMLWEKWQDSWKEARELGKEVKMLRAELKELSEHHQKLKKECKC